MTTALHAALGEPGTELTFDLVRRACVQRIEETEQLDWKEFLPLPGSGTNPTEAHLRLRRLELAKDLAAMANTRGGLLVYGVREALGSRADTIVGIDIDESADVTRRIHEVAFSHLYPPVQVRCHLLTDDTSGGEVEVDVADLNAVARSDGGGPAADVTSEVADVFEKAESVPSPQRSSTGPLQVLVVEVEESADSPHLVQPKRDGGNDGWLIAPIRNGSDTVNMVEKQIESAYRDRFENRRRQSRYLVDGYDELRDRHISFEDRDAGTVVAFILPTRLHAGPLLEDRPRAAACSIVESGLWLAQEIVARLRIPSDSLLAQLVGEAASAQPRRSVRRFVFSSSKQHYGTSHDPIGRPADVVLEVHDDGALGLVWRRGDFYRASRRPGDGPSRPSLAPTDLDLVAVFVTSYVLALGEEFELDEFMIRVGIEANDPLTIAHYEGEVSPVWETRRIPPAPTVDADIRLQAGPEVRAGDMLDFGHQLNNMIERSEVGFEGFWHLPRHARPDNPTILLAQRILGGTPDHPVSGRAML